MPATPASLRAPPARPLSPGLVRRRRPQLLLPAPVARPAPSAAAAATGDTLRFFVTCYAAGLVFFLVMLS